MINELKFIDKLLKEKKKAVARILTSLKQLKQQEDANV